MYVIYRTSNLKSVIMVLVVSVVLNVLRISLSLCIIHTFPPADLSCKMGLHIIYQNINYFRWGNKYPLPPPLPPTYFSRKRGVWNIHGSGLYTVKDGNV